MAKEIVVDSSNSQQHENSFWAACHELNRATRRKKTASKREYCTAAPRSYFSFSALEHIVNNKGIKTHKVHCNLQSSDWFIMRYAIAFPAFIWLSQSQNSCFVNGLNQMFSAFRDLNQTYFSKWYYRTTIIKMQFYAFHIVLTRNSHSFSIW